MDPDFNINSNVNPNLSPLKPISESKTPLSKSKQEKIQKEKSIEKSEAKQILKKTKEHIDKIEIKNVPNKERISTKLREVSDELKALDSDWCIIDSTEDFSDWNLIEDETDKSIKSKSIRNNSDISEKSLKPIAIKTNKYFDINVTKQLELKKEELADERQYHDEITKQKLVEFLNPSEIANFVQFKIEEKKENSVSYFESLKMEITKMGVKVLQGALGVETLCFSVTENFFNFYQKHIAAKNNGYNLLKNLPTQAKELAERLIVIDAQIKELDRLMSCWWGPSVEEIESKKIDLEVERYEICKSLEPLTNELLEDKLGDLVPKLLSSVVQVSESYLVTMAEVSTELKQKYQYFEFFPMAFKEYLILNAIAEQKNINPDQTLSAKFNLEGLAIREKKLMLKYGKILGRIDEINQALIRKQAFIDYAESNNKINKLYDYLLIEKKKLEQELEELSIKKEKMKPEYLEIEKKIQNSLDKDYSGDLDKYTNKLVDKIYLILFKNIELDSVARISISKLFNIRGSLYKSSEEILKGVLQLGLSKIVSRLSDPHVINALILYGLNVSSKEKSVKDVSSNDQDKFMNEIVKSLVGELNFIDQEDEERIAKLNRSIMINFIKLIQPDSPTLVSFEKFVYNIYNGPIMGMLPNFFVDKIFNFVQHSADLEIYKKAIQIDHSTFENVLVFIKEKIFEKSELIIPTTEDEIKSVKTESLNAINDLIDNYCVKNLNQSFAEGMADILIVRAAKIFNSLQYKSTNRLLLMELLKTLGDQLEVD